MRITAPATQDDFKYVVGALYGLVQLSFTEYELNDLVILFVFKGKVAVCEQ